MTYGLKIWNPSGVEVLNLTNNTGLIVAQYNYGPFSSSGNFQYIETNDSFLGCTAFSIIVRSRMFTQVNATVVGNQVITRISCVSSGGSELLTTYVATYVIDPGSL